MDSLIEGTPPSTREQYSDCLMLSRYILKTFQTAKVEVRRAHGIGVAGSRTQGIWCCQYSATVLGHPLGINPLSSSVITLH